jgi:hypothetical protein
MYDLTPVSVKKKMTSQHELTLAQEIRPLSRTNIEADARQPFDHFISNHASTH